MYGYLCARQGCYRAPMFFILSLPLIALMIGLYLGMEIVRALWPWLLAIGVTFVLYLVVHH
jgi:hypothetical protein